MRGLALLSVVLFHLFGAGRVSGGIDIFLAVSGFLFTGMLLREATATGGRIDLARYVGRLVRRILVPAGVVIVITVVVGLWMLPSSRHAQLWAEARASLLYFENIELINSQLAYGAAGPETSPFQHFWSLSIQGQFYLLWPLVAILAVLAARALKVPAVWVMAGIVGVIFAGSLLYAISVGAYNQDAAYLMSSTRAWELAVGALLALAIGAVRLPRPLRVPAGWVGVGLIVSCGFVLDGAELFPGPWALWPLTGLALVLAAAGAQGGDQDPQGSATRFLSNRVFGWIGDHAYGLYLWHWPLLIFYLQLRGRDSVGIGDAALLLAITVVLAVLMFRYLERPLQSLQAQRTSSGATNANRLIAGLAAGVLVVGGTGTTAVIHQVEGQRQTQTAPVFEDWDWQNHPGALAATDSTIDIPEVDFLPEVDELATMRPDYPAACQQPVGDNPGTGEVTVCEDPNAPEDPSATVVLAGGSHAGQWYRAFRALASEYTWELLVVNKSGCVFRDIQNPHEDMCSAWNANFIDWLHANHVDMVITPGTRLQRHQDPESAPDTAAETWQDESIPDGALNRWQEIVEAGTELLLIRGVPRPDQDMADCLATEDDPRVCAPRISNLQAENPLDGLALPQNVSTIDLTRDVCPNAVGHTEREVCDPIIGNVVVWHDDSHLSNQYVGTLTPILERSMRAEVSWLF